MFEKIVNGTTLWSENSEPVAQYPWLDNNETCDVAIIGAGIAGAMCAEKFAAAGIDTILVSASPVGYGMSMGSFGTAEYFVDGGFEVLSQRIGQDAAFKVYQMLSESLDNIETLNESLGGNIDFQKKDSFCYTDEPKLVSALNKEYLALHHNNYDVGLVDSTNSFYDFSYEVLLGIYGNNLGVEVNPYKLTQALAAKAENDGARVYENTEVKNVTVSGGKHVLTSGTNHTITANKVVYASGIETAKDVHNTCFRTTFTVVTNPVSEFKGWKNQCITTKLGTEMFKIRTTAEGRIIISGLPAKMIDAEGRLLGMIPATKIVDKKHSELLDLLKTNFKGIHGLKAEYKYSSILCETSDMLPVIGNTQEDPNVFYALCGGSNGLSFAEIASRLIFEQYKGTQNPDISIFAKDRKVKAFI